MSESHEERPRYCSQPVSILACVAGNVERADGTPVVIVTIGKPMGRIEPLAISREDARKLVGDLLVALATIEDKFAQNLLDDRFPSTDEGKYYYPTPETF